MANQGNMHLGIIAGFIMMGIVGWVPLIGPLIAGVIAGAIAKGSWRGMQAGLFAGVAGLIVVMVIAASVGSLLNGYTNGILDSFARYEINDLNGALYLVGGILSAALGGFIGGAFSPAESYSKAGGKVRLETGPDVRSSFDNSPTNALKLRYAQGKITKKQYLQMKKELGE